MASEKPLATGDPLPDSKTNDDFMSSSTINSAKEEETANDTTQSDGPSTQMNYEINVLARHLTGVSTTVGAELNAFSPQALKAFVRLAESEEGSAPPCSLGVAFRNLNVFGWGSGAQHQKSVINYTLDIVSFLVNQLSPQRKQRVDILRNFEGVVEQGELLLVLGPPGSGCSTLLKTIAGETAGLEVGPDSYMNFRGIEESRMRSSFRGDVLYNAEVDTHLAHLTVGDTLSFTSSAHSLRHVIDGFTRAEPDTMMRDVTMAIFGISHRVDTRVGDDFVRGVSGGERKRVSIARAASQEQSCSAGITQLVDWIVETPSTSAGH